MDQQTDDLAQATLYAYCALVNRLCEIGLHRGALTKSLLDYAELAKDLPNSENVVRYLAEFAESVAKEPPRRKTVH